MSMLVNLSVLFLVMLMLVNLCVLFLVMLMLVNLSILRLIARFPLRKLNKVKLPKWEKCDYVHVPSRPVSVSCPVTRPVKRPVKRHVKHHVTPALNRPVPQSTPCLACSIPGLPPGLQ